MIRMEDSSTILYLLSSPRHLVILSPSDPFTLRPRTGCQEFRDWPEAAAMLCRRPINMQRLLVHRRPIALMLREPIDWRRSVELGHHPIAGDFRNDRGSRDRKTARVAFDQRALRVWPTFELDCVDQQCVGRPR